ncbi:23S rRNA (pseudouridine(1915)-N(3))-methyltransferase RlmH [Desulfurobacterium atlanticum]|uniref:Ribosomal RNA large subunit methyltransferase H n=1 Tax=Desulfurobacterium atlanticum TaxID=240169 RepID=A0A238YZ99_9BACT|nr:23S rRNA (pseudouridine(1915)-N(3))-methyltransferase RlmH [Desulfurobacterium atlanticum]SNR76004.1 23S rRNA (pseudouridine1915-N3)-methyltransferase [Desulfurobacterium atlanticum]
MLKVIAVGKIPHHLKEVQEFYRSKIEKLTNFEIVEIKKQRTKDEEGNLLLKKRKGFTIALDERGKELDSVQFSKLIEKHPNISFIIGGADGLSETVKQNSDMILSLSKLTMQHDIARIVLLEQIYRGFQIIRNTPYHRE